MIQEAAQGVPISAHGRASRRYGTHAESDGMLGEGRARANADNSKTQRVGSLLVHAAAFRE